MFTTGPTIYIFSRDLAASIGPHVCLSVGLSVNFFEMLSMTHAFWSVTHVVHNPCQLVHNPCQLVRNPCFLLSVTHVSLLKFSLVCEKITKQTNLWANVFSHDSQGMKHQQTGPGFYGIRDFLKYIVSKIPEEEAEVTAGSIREKSKVA